MDDAPFVPLGRVVKVHGVKGEVSVAFATGLPFTLPVGTEVWVVPPPVGPVTYRVESVRQGPKGPLVKLSNVDDRQAAEALRDRSLMVRSCDLPEGFLDDVPFDAKGLVVEDVDRGLLGHITDTIVTGANDVWVVDGGRFGQVLIPVIDEVIISIDADAGCVEVRLLPGLIEDEGEVLR